MNAVQIEQAITELAEQPFDAANFPYLFLQAFGNKETTIKGKARFIVATDGLGFEAEVLTRGETVPCAFKDFPDHFGFFLPLAGISTVRQITENACNIRATSRLLKDNSERGKNDTERLEKLFELHTKMTAGAARAKAKKRKRASA